MRPQELKIVLNKWMMMSVKIKWFYFSSVEHLLILSSIKRKKIIDPLYKRNDSIALIKDFPLSNHDVCSQREHLYTEESMHCLFTAM